MRWTDGLLPYTAAVARALGGASLGAADAGSPVLAGAAGVGLAPVVAALVGRRGLTLRGR